MKFSTFQGLRCFEIAHTNECNGLFCKIERKGHHNMWTIPAHDDAKSLENLYASEHLRRSSRARNPGISSKLIRLGGHRRHIDNDNLTADSGLYTSTSPSRSSAQNDKNKVQTTRNRQQKSVTRISTHTPCVLKAKHTKKRRRQRMLNVAYI